MTDCSKPGIGSYYVLLMNRSRSRGRILTETETNDRTLFERHMKPSTSVKQPIRITLSAIALLCGLGLGTAGAASGPRVVLPLVPGWHNGTKVLYIQTEASDPAVAQSQDVNYVAGLAGAVGTTTVDDIYVVSNFQQPNIVASAPKPLGPKNADPDYTPLWQVSVVTWNQAAKPRELTSEAAVQAAATGGELTITKMRIIVNCPIMNVDKVGTLPTAQIIGAMNHQRVILPLVPGWYKGAPVLYLQTEASDAAVAKAQNVNYVPRLAAAANTTTVDDIYVVSNFQQANVVASEPNPLGPQNADPNYSPLWQVSSVTWNKGATPRLLTSEADVQAAASNNELTITKTGIIVNCPIMASTLPTAQIFNPNIAP
jgi:hypothetical protein